MNPKVLLLNSCVTGEAEVFGYGNLTEQLNDLPVIHVHRRDPVSLAGRAITKISRLGAASAWYRSSSLKLEISALRRMRTERFDLVHVLWGDSDLGHLTWLRPRQTKLVVTLHNVPENLTLNFPRPDLLKRVDGFILMAPTQEDFLTKAGIHPRACKFIPHGIDVSRFHPPIHRQRASKLRVLHVGSYLRDFATLAEVTRLANRDIFEFHILAPPDIHRKYHFSDNVVWHHGLSPQGLVDFYRDGDLLLMTATSATANNALLEGLACGLPVVCQNISGLLAYLDSECAAIASDSTPAALTNILTTLSKDPERRENMTHAARQRALDFAWPSVAAATRDFYSEVIG